MLKKYILSCKDVTHLASDYLDHNADAKLHWKIRLHLMVCNCCRRFVRHLQITKKVVPQFIQNNLQQPTEKVDAESVLRQIKERLKTRPG